MRRRLLINNNNKPTSYLDVEPKEVQWITMESVIYNVKSNVTWNIR